MSNLDANIYLTAAIPLNLPPMGALPGPSHETEERHIPTISHMSMPSCNFPHAQLLRH